MARETRREGNPTAVRPATALHGEDTPTRLGFPSPRPGARACGLDSPVVGAVPPRAFLSRRVDSSRAGGGAGGGRGALHGMKLVASLAIAIVLLAAGSQAAAQTSYLPPTASSSLDRIAQAPLTPPPPTWDAYAPQAAQVFPTPGPSSSTWAPSAIGGQPGYPGYSTAAPSLVPPQAPPQQASLFPAGYPSQGQTFQQTMHVFQGVRGSWAYLMGDGNDLNVGVNELDTTATFALPFFHNSPTCPRAPTTSSSTPRGIRSSRRSGGRSWASASASTPTGTCSSGRVGASWAGPSARCR